MEAQVERIKNNLQQVREQIARAAASAGRSPEDVQLVVVSKTQPAEVIRDAYQAGVRDFGENYPQEAEVKIGQLGDLDEVCWHMIGHLQSRKVPIVAKCFHKMHSLDSLALAVKLDRALAERGKKIKILLEVNVAGEASKFGWSGGTEAEWQLLLPEFRQIAALPQFEILGLMTMPPLFEEPERSRPFFQKLRQLARFLQHEIPGTAWTELSMGTSSDYEIAISEGATLVRIGRAILGERTTQKIILSGEQQ